MGRALVLTFVAVGLLSAAFAAPAQAADRDIITQEIQAADKADTTFKAYWKNGLNFATSDGKFKMKIGGRIQLDTWFVTDDNDRDRFNDIADFGPGRRFNSGAEFRRVRLFMSGSMYDYVAWKAQFDFAPIAEDEFLFDDNRNAGDALTDAFTFADVYIQLHNLDKCWGCWFPDITMGHFKEYFSLELMTSSRHTTFMERAMPVEAFAPARNIGIGLQQDMWGGRFYYGIGWWADTPGFGNEVEYFRERGQHITGRLVFMPWAPCDCESQFWQIGVSGSYQFDNPNGYRYRTRPENHIVGRILDTGTIPATESTLFGVETAFVYDRFKIQGEWIGAMPDIGGDPLLQGFYAYGSYLLGGKGFTYKRSHQTFGAIAPCSDFDCSGCGSWGALELAVRYSYLDFTEVGEGEAANFTVGLNWYLNANTKIMFNYVYSDVTNYRGTILDGKLSMFGVRFQVYW